MARYSNLYDGKSPEERAHLRQRAQQIRNRKKTLGRYGLDPDDFERMVARQGGVCAICREAPGDGKVLCVDHCHKSGLNRALLCSECNAAIGKLHHDEARLASAISYLKHWRGVHAHKVDRSQLPIWD